MSNLKIQGNASGTGTTTLQSGNTNSNLTLALPIADGTANQALVTDGAGVLSFASTGTGDVVGPSSSVDSELALFNSTTGKLIKRASLTGLVKATSGVASAATSGTDYLAPPSGTAILKANSGALYINCKSPLYKVRKLFFKSASVTIVLPVFGVALNEPAVYN